MDSIAEERAVKLMKMENMQNAISRAHQENVRLTRERGLRVARLKAKRAYKKTMKEFKQKLEDMRAIHDASMTRLLCEQIEDIAQEKFLEDHGRRFEGQVHDAEKWHQATNFAHAVLTGSSKDSLLRQYLGFEAAVVDDDGESSEDLLTS